MKAAIVTAAGKSPVFGEFDEPSPPGSGTYHRQRIGFEPVQ
jgi:hypothetical protein